MKERIHWIDWSKCILIYLVVVAHYGRISPFVDNLICAFHMPAFFMISGYLHKQMPVKQSVIKNFKRLIVPAFLFSLLCWGYFVALMVIKDVPFTFDGYVSKFLFGMIFYDRPNVTPPCGVIWFLQVLFISKILLDIVARYGDKAIFAACAVCAVATWVWYTADINDMRYQFLLQRTCASFPFVALGYVAKEKQLFLKLSRVGWLPYLLLALYLVGVVYNGRVGIATWRFGHDVVLYYLVALTGCICFFLFVNKIKFGGGNLLINISNGTIIILCLHRIMISLAYHVPLGAYIGSLVIVVLCYPLILFFNKYLPWFTGKFSK